MMLSPTFSNSANDNTCLVWNNNQLSYIGQDVRQIPAIIIKIYGPIARKLDLSFNIIDTLEGIEDFPALEELILDNNLLDDSVKFCFNPLLHTLSLNKNKISDLEKLLSELSRKCPNLKFFSLLGNSACPDQLSSTDKDEEDYQRYRRYVIYRLPHLRFLDSTKVRSQERKDAFERGKYFKIVRPDSELTIVTEELFDKYLLHFLMKTIRVQELIQVLMEGLNTDIPESIRKEIDSSETMNYERI